MVMTTFVTYFAVALSIMHPIHLPKKRLPEITFPRKALGRNYVISNVHLPERAFAPKLHFPKRALARNYISLNVHLPEIT